MELDPRLRPSAHRPPGPPHSSSTPSTSLNTTAGPSPTQACLDDSSKSPHASSYTTEASVVYHNAGGAAHTPPSAATTIGPTGAESAVDNDPLADLKRPRACEACRQLKVRCDPEPNHPLGSCKRCAKANRLCVVTAPTRKRQKKSDSRVAELERKIDALTESLHASRARNQGHGTASEGDNAQAAPVQDRPSGRLLGMFAGHDRTGPWGSNNNSGAGNVGSLPSGLAGQKRQSNGEVKAIYQNMGILGPLARPSSPTGQGPSTAKEPQKSFFETLWPSYDTVPKAQENEYMDVIDRGVVDTEIATKAFNRYTMDMAPLMPFVIFPESTTMADIRRTKPILFLTILSVAVPAFAPSLQMPLVNESHRVFADRAIVRGHKTLELVQAILISCMWYTPPEHFEEMKFYQLIHLAAVIGMELGMNRRAETKSKTSSMWKEIMGRRFPTVSPDCLEARRVWLGCYFMSVSASMSLRRPLLTRWNPYMDESLDVLRTSQDALPSDSALIHWVKLAHISEEITFQFSMDDPITNVTFTDPRIQYALKGFERQMDDWRKNVPPELYSSLMEHFENVVILYMHEIAMHVDHNIDDFKPPFLTDLTENKPTDMGTPAHVEALTSCLTAIHRVYDVFCSFEPSVLHDLPTVSFVRTSYCTVALVRLYTAATTPGSKIAQIFHPSVFKVEHYLDKVTHQLKAATEVDSGRVMTKFLSTVIMLKTWFSKRKEGKRTFTQGPFALFKDNGSTSRESESVPAASGSPQQNTSGARPTSLRLLSEVALGHSNTKSKESQQQQGQPQTSNTTAVSDSTFPLDNTSFVTPSSAPVSLPTSISTSNTADLPLNPTWHQLATQSLSAPQSAPQVASSLPVYQQTYAQNPDQTFMEQDGFDMQFQLPPEPQMQDFVSDLNMLSGQVDGFELLWGGMWDDTFYPRMMEGNEGGFPS